MIIIILKNSPIVNNLTKSKMNVRHSKLKQTPKYIHIYRHLKRIEFLKEFHSCLKVYY